MVRKKKSISFSNLLMKEEKIISPLSQEY